MKEPIVLGGATKYIGESRKRTEDPQILMGQAKYVDDIKIPGMLEVAFLRSTHGHARIKSLNLEKARQHPDCLRIITNDDLSIGFTTFIPGTRGTLKPVFMPFIGTGKVRFVGEIIRPCSAESLHC